MQQLYCCTAEVRQYNCRTNRMPDRCLSAAPKDRTTFRLPYRGDLQVTTDFQPSARPTSDALNAILGKPYPVLDDGFVRVVDYMGSDESIVQAARISYGSGTKKVRATRGLLRYLMRHGHTTPFEMCEIKLHVRVPMDTWRQWIRHRTANVNEYSTRYSEAIDESQRTPSSEWRIQSTGNRQGSSGNLSEEVGGRLTDRERALQEHAREVYRERLAAGVAREQARKDLPLSTYTEAYWKIDLHNLLHFLAVRMESHAQGEIRAYATLIGEEIVSKWCPMTWDAFLDYRVESQVLSRLDKELLAKLIGGDAEAATELAESYGWLQRDETGLKPNRERQEFEEKARSLGIEPTWL